MEQGNGQCRACNAIRQVAQPTAKSDANGNASGDGDAIKMQDKIERSDRISHAGRDVRRDGGWCKGKGLKEEK